MFASFSHLPVIHNCSNTGVCRAEWENIYVTDEEDFFGLIRKSSDVKKEPDGGEVELEVEEDKGHWGQQAQHLHLGGSFLFWRSSC